MLHIKEPVCEAKVFLQDGTFVMLKETGMGGWKTGRSTPQDRIFTKLQCWRRDGGGFVDTKLWIPFHAVTKIEFYHKEDKDQ
jgi:hypothetical protein